MTVPNDTQTEKKAKGYKVLLVDDDSFLMDMYSRKFSQEGDEVRASLSVADALDTLRGGFVPDIVAFDVVMPQQNGFDFLQSMKDEKLAPDACRVALTNQWEEEHRTKAEEWGVSAYLIKAEMIPSEVVTKVHQIASECLGKK
jgi:CheY-like chemotaxis protein